MDRESFNFSVKNAACKERADKKRYRKMKVNRKKAEVI